MSFFCGYLESAVLPASNEKVAKLKDRIHGRETARTYRRADRQWLFGQGRYIYNYLHYDPQQASLQRLQVFDFDDQHRLTRRLFTEEAHYIGDAWVFNNGWARSFKGVDVTGYARFKEPKIVRYPETPAYFDSEIRPPEQMRYGELKEYIQELKESGQSVPELAGRAGGQDRATRGLADHGAGRPPLRLPPGAAGGALRDRPLAGAGDRLSWRSTPSSPSSARRAPCRRSWRSGARERSSPCSRATCSWA